MAFIKKLSIIVPVYKEEKNIKKNLEQLKLSTASLMPSPVKEIEIIVVIDGYADNSLTEAKKVSGIKVVGYEDNKGKGHALKYGFKFVSGEAVTFIDSDNDLPPMQIINFFPYLATADMVIGSKRHPFSLVNYPAKRKILSKGFQLISWLILGVNLRDTQSGLKIIKREVLEVIMPLILIKRYAFDLELCFLAQKHGFRIVEAPLHVDFQSFKGASSVKLSTPFHMLLDVIAIRYRYSILKYYQKEYQRTKFNIKNQQSK